MTDVAVAWWRLPHLPARDAGCTYPISRNPDRLLSAVRDLASVELRLWRRESPI